MRKIIFTFIFICMLSSVFAMNETFSTSPINPDLIIYSVRSVDTVSVVDGSAFVNTTGTGSGCSYFRTNNYIGDLFDVFGTFTDVNFSQIKTTTAGAGAGNNVTVWLSNGTTNLMLFEARAAYGDNVLTTTARGNLSLLTGNNVTYAFNGASASGSIVMSGNRYLKFEACSRPTTDSHWIKLDYIKGDANFNLANSKSFFNCDDETNGQRFIKFDFRNETTTASVVNASITSTFSYYKSGDSTNSSYSYSSTTEKVNYSFCATPFNRTLLVNPIINYYNSESPTRTYQPATLSLTNSSTNVLLYLLPSSSGIYVSFQVVDSSTSPISDARVIITKSGSEIESRLTDASGIATFWLDPTSSYNVSASKSGYSSFSESITPTQTSYTISLGSGTTLDSPIQYSKGITYSLLPNLNTLVNGTNYGFNFTINSSYWDLDSFGIVITNSSGATLMSSVNSASVGGGVVGGINNTRSNVYLKINAFWLIDGNYTNITRTYYITNTEGSEFSIWRFFTDFKTYVTNENDTDGLYGLKASGNDNFSLALIVFVLIFSFAGVMSYKYGLTSPAAIFMFVFAATWFFEVTLELIDVSEKTTVPILTLVVGIFALGSVYREVTT